MTKDDSPTARPAMDPVAETILQMVEALETGRTLDPQEVAQAFAERKRTRKDPPDLWRRYLAAVRQQALFLARQGKIRLIRKGQTMDPHKPVKGLLRLAPAEVPATPPSGVSANPDPETSKA